MIATPGAAEFKKLLTPDVYKKWLEAEAFAHTHYNNVKTLWNKGGKGGVYECKFMRAGAKLFYLYAREGSFGFMVIFGKKEREMFEGQRADFSPAVLKVYDSSKVYHDGIWLMYEVTAKTNLAELEKLVFIKKKADK